MRRRLISRREEMTSGVPESDWKVFRDLRTWLSRGSAKAFLMNLSAFIWMRRGVIMNVTLMCTACCETETRNWRGHSTIRGARR